MKMPARDFEPMADWANRNGWTPAEAMQQFLGNNEFEGNAHWVRYSPTVVKRPEYVKISKSDQ